MADETKPPVLPAALAAYRDGGFTARGCELSLDSQLHDRISELAEQRDESFGLARAYALEHDDEAKRLAAELAALRAGASQQ